MNVEEKCSMFSWVARSVAGHDNFVFDVVEDAEADVSAELR